MSLALYPFRRHVGHRAYEGFFTFMSLSDLTANAKVSEFTVALSVQKDVAGLDITMNHTSSLMKI